MELCNDFNNRYTDYRNYKTDPEIVEMRAWVRNKLKWFNSNIDSINRIKVLRENEAVIKLFNYFEDAKMLDQKRLLDRDFFLNRFYSLFLRLEKANNPPVEVYINSYRKDLTDKVWDGYYYCRELVFKLHKEKEKMENKFVL
ncbi:MAG: hypothetical protein LBJ63_08810 [Prevotellaceae bacterium]|nr:hypothetical protein [Prevotellaceae bacterium]